MEKRSKPEILEVTYEDEIRKTIQGIDYTIVDDLYLMSNMYGKLASIYNSYLSGFTPFENFELQRNETQAEIDQQLNYIDGYSPITERKS